MESERDGGGGRDGEEKEENQTKRGEEWREYERNVFRRPFVFNSIMLGG